MSRPGPIDKGAPIKATMETDGLTPEERAALSKLDQLLDARFCSMPTAIDDGTAKKPATKDAVKVLGQNPFKKYSDASNRTGAVQALFRGETGIGLKPEMRRALIGEMRAAATMFIENPPLANTREGADMLMQLMSNVEGFPELAG